MIIIQADAGIKGYKVWLLEEKKCGISKNVKFREDIVYKDVVKEKVLVPPAAEKINKTLGKTYTEIQLKDSSQTKDDT